MIGKHAVLQRGFMFAFVALGVISTVSAGWSLRWPLLIAKPMLAPTLAMYLLFGPSPRRMILPFVVGLTLATAGDVVLLPEFPSTACVLVGIALFAGMHFSYAYGFLRVSRPAVKAAGAYAVVWGVVAMLLWRQLPTAIRPVAVVYAAMICAMATTASALGRSAVLGGVLFVVSDFLLALIFFTGMFGSITMRNVSSLVVMGTYVSAQGLLIVTLQQSIAGYQSTVWRRSARSGGSATAT